MKLDASLRRRLSWEEVELTWSMVVVRGVEEAERGRGPARRVERDERKAKERTNASLSLLLTLHSTLQQHHQPLEANTATSRLTTPLPSCMATSKYSLLSSLRRVQERVSLTTPAPSTGTPHPSSSSSSSPQSSSTLASSLIKSKHASPTPMDVDDQPVASPQSDSSQVEILEERNGSPPAGTKRKGGAGE